jgi:hypothetical protein
VNTLYECYRHNKEINLYRFYFEHFFISRYNFISKYLILYLIVKKFKILLGKPIASNKIFIGRNSEMPSNKEIINLAESYKNSFFIFNVDTDWLLINVFNLNQKSRNQICYNHNILLLENICYIE